MSEQKNPPARPRWSLRTALFGDCPTDVCRACRGPALDFGDSYTRQKYRTTRLCETCQFLSSLADQYDCDEPESGQ